MTCSGVNGTSAINPSYHDCSCGDGEIIVEKDIAGNYLSSKICMKCPNNTYPVPQPPAYECKACPEGMINDKTSNPYKCVCDLTNFVTAGDECIPLEDAQFILTNYAPNSAKGLNFYNAEVDIINFRQSIQKWIVKSRSQVQIL
jgi:hypothetical protein